MIKDIIVNLEHDVSRDLARDFAISGVDIASDNPCSDKA